MKNKFELGQDVKLKSGLIGRIVGFALYIWGYEYRIMIPNRKRALYRKESELTSIS